ncbi:WD40-repeat-containing domain protein [Dipodascopsis uninucleata]
MESKNFYGPVTALEFLYHNLLLAGRGNVLSIYNWRSGLLLKEYKLFEQNKIKGFAVGRNNILLWGGKSFAFVSLSALLEDAKIRELVCHDWIMTCRFDNNDQPFILTAHNQLLRVDKTLARFDLSFSGIDSILYSGDIFIENNRILVAAGTVLGGIEIWSPSGSTSMIKLEGHEGSIFGVYFSPDGKKVVSCSDDRAIRVWNIGSKLCEAIGWGHLARIWNVKFFKELIISTSEDNTTRTWIVNGGKLEVEQVWEGHSGRSIWSLALCSDPSNIFATGGADGRIRLWDSELKQTIDLNRKIISFQEIADSTSQKVGIKHYFESSKSYVFSAISGALLDYSLQYNKWNVVYSDETLRGYSIIKPWKEVRYTSIGNRNGEVTVLNLDHPEIRVCLRPLEKNIGKVMDIVTLKHDNLLYLLVQYDKLQSSWALHILDSSNTEHGHTQLNPLYSSLIERPMTFPISVAMLLEDTGVIIVASRFGALALLSGSVEKGYKILKCWRRVISEDAITSLVRISRETFDILITSRNGSYLVCNICFSEGEVDLSSIHLNRLPKGSIEGSAFIQNEFIFWGFRSNYFFVWNETQQTEIMSEVCGGPHRHWLFKLEQDFHYTFMYTKSSSICITTNTDFPKFFERSIIQDGSHGREIRSLAVSPLRMLDNSILLASGAEDTCIRLTSVQSNGSIRNICVLRKHVSGIQEIKWSIDGEYMFSSSAREEFFAWKVTLRGEQVFLYPVASAPIESEVPDLRVMDFVTKKIDEARYIIACVYSDSTIKVFLFNTVMRTIYLICSGKYKMTCIFKVIGLFIENGFYLVIGSSDGYISYWDLSFIVDSLRMTSVDNELPRYDFPAMKSGIKIHQNSIRAMITIKSPFSVENDNIISILSGGDDNSIALTELHLDLEKLIKTDSIEDAHASTVTDLIQLGSGEVLSSAVDQMIKLWNISDDSQKLIKAGEHYTIVSDTGCLEIGAMDVGKVILLIAGAGLDIAFIHN